MAVENGKNTNWENIRRLVWGSDVKGNVYSRWLQPFSFSNREPTALLQFNGGPCAVLAPLQAFILKQVIRNQIKDLQSLEERTIQTLLVTSLCEILTQCRSPGKPFQLCHINKIMEGNHATNTSEGEDIGMFEDLLTVTKFDDSENLVQYLARNYQIIFGKKYDVLSFLYSVVLTKGTNVIINERQDADEPLIDPLHGHGSQALVNLLLAGVATANVFDGVRDLGGLPLQGISSRSSVGFLSLLECLRYVEVGSNLKIPQNPVWVLGSETHLTVLFSYCQDLVKPPSERDAAIVTFKELDPDNSGFISTDSLQPLMSKLDLFAEPEYVDVMKKKLDSENMGIILLPVFLEEFFPGNSSHSPDSFNLHHYNGLSKLGYLQPKYVSGNAIPLEGVHGIAESDPILQVIQTKWPSINIEWDEETPSIN
jgi:hypothetical protein